MGKLSNIGHALYEGRISIDFVGRKWLWYSISAVILVAAIAGLAVRGVNLGIEFSGGVEYQVTLPSDQVTQANVAKIRDAVAREAGAANIDAASSPIVNTSGSNNIRVQTEPLNNDQADQISAAIEKSMGVRHRRDQHGRDRGDLGRRRRQARAAGPRASSWCWWCSSSGRTSASGRCPSARSSPSPTTC